MTYVVALDVRGTLLDYDIERNGETITRFNGGTQTITILQELKKLGAKIVLTTGDMSPQIDEFFTMLREQYNIEPTFIDGIFNWEGYHNNNFSRPGVTQTAGNRKNDMYAQAVTQFASGDSSKIFIFDDVEEIITVARRKFQHCYRITKETDMVKYLEQVKDIITAKPSSNIKWWSTSFNINRLINTCLV